MTDTGRPLLKAATAVILTLMVSASPVSAGDDNPSTRTSHGLSLFDSLKYPAEFKHLEYVNPTAPKGGDVRLSSIGSFDTLNPFTLKGRPAAGASLIYDQLLTSAADEPSSEYGLLAQSVEVPDDKSWVEFTLRAEAAGTTANRLPRKT